MGRLFLFFAVVLCGHGTVRAFSLISLFSRHSSWIQGKKVFIETVVSPTTLASNTSRRKVSLGSSKKYGEALFTQVVSDVDDTLKSSGGVNIAGIALGGIDVQYPRGEIYPGVAEFMLQISLGPTRRENPTPPKVAILTARAQEFKLALELKDDDSILATAFRQAAQAAGIDGWGLGPVLYGSVAEWIAQDRKGLRKFVNFEQLLQQDPTNGRILQYVYVGDTGELDQQAGETMLREYPTFVKAVFLHCVSDKVGGNAYVPPPKLINGRPIVFFRTFVGAALAATQLDLISLAGLQSVIAAASARLKDVPYTSDKWTDLTRDIDRAAVVLKRY